MPAPAALLLAFDYLDPISFLLDRALGEILAPGVKVERLALELAPPHLPLLSAESHDWKGRVRTGLREGPTLGIRLEPPALLPRTRKAHELALLGREQGCFPSLHNALFQACLLEGRDVGRVDELVRVAESVGLDAALSRVTLDVDRFAQEVEAQLARTEALDIHVTPTLLWDGGGLEGYLPPDRLRTLLPPGLLA
ncbi:MAG: DsbA family protein [Gemmatimonadota bacterium]